MNGAPREWRLSAVLLAGGRSERMGRDKALLPMADGSFLWQRQIDVLRALGPKELWISGPVRPGFPKEIRTLEDKNPGLGPLAGIAAALEAAKMGLVAVLAIDMPAMTSDYLAGLVAECESGRGLTPVRNGRFEPLAAVYPCEALEIANRQLESADRSLQAFVEALVGRKMVGTRVVGGAEEALFANWNEPGQRIDGLGA